MTSTAPLSAPLSAPPTIPIFTFGDGSKLFKFSAKFFAMRFPVWEGNRILDESHVASLEASATAGELQGPFSVISYTDDEGRIQNRVIDGQHRQAVLRHHFETNAAAEDFEVLVRRYPNTDHATAIRIFQQINNAKPMVYRGSTTERLHDIVTALKRRFLSERTGGSLTALIRPSTNRPFLSTELLEDALKLYGIHERADLTPERIVEHAISMNAFYAEDPNRVTARYTQATLNRAIEHGFYLGLDPRCSWLQALRPGGK
jgi:hypothetical protein